MSPTRKSGFLLTGIRFYPALLLCISIVLVFFTCFLVKNKHSKIDPIHFLKHHKFDASIPVEERTGQIPVKILNYVRALDGIKSYTGYTPDISDRTEIKLSLSLMPPRIKKIMQERLIGIYFVNGFHGSGLTEWVVDEQNLFYGFIIINPESLKQDLTEFITSKELSCFRDDDKNVDIIIDCGEKYTGFLYIILHEAVHLVDYAEFITPYVEEGVLPFRGEIPGSTPFTEEVWNGYDKPENRFPNMDKVTFYGFGGGPKLSISEAAKTYAGMKDSPFVSLYGSMNWSEDLAETVTFYHINSILKKPYRIIVTNNKNNIFLSNPMERPAVKKRLQLIRNFY